MATLGISTNTRLLGMAIITRNGLTDYSIRLDKSSWSAEKAERIVAGLEPCVRRYSIKKVVLSIPYAHHQTKESKILLSRITEFFQAKGIPVVTDSPNAMYTFCEKGQKKTKKAAMRSLAELFPILRTCYIKEMRNRNKYYVKLFEAVAVAAVETLKE